MTTRCWIRNLFSRPPRTVRKAPARCRFVVEILEDRMAPANLTLTHGSTGDVGGGIDNAGTMTVTKAPLTVTADDKMKITGEANPTFTVDHSGFVLGDDASVLGGTLTFSSAATASSLPGAYDIIPDRPTSGNYAMTFVKGTLNGISYSQAMANLRAQVDAAELATGMQRSPDTQLQAAISYFSAGDTADGVSELSAFINHVSTQRGQLGKYVGFSGGYWCHGVLPCD
jgi:hypothetical protein